jgi:prepilin-type N-terminal cleavage/methylation domain-containing protein
MNFQAGKIRSGFTLIELLVVVSIIAILAAVIGVNALASNQKSRDAKRQADVRTLQTSIELYKQKYGRYPEGCRGHDTWSGQEGSDYACTGGSTQYIIGHVDTTDADGDGDTTERFNFAPEFIPVLPFDKKLNGTNSGYAYVTNQTGTVFKVIAMNTVESDAVNYLHPLKSCDTRPGPDGGVQNMGPTGVDTSGWCETATVQALTDPAGNSGVQVSNIPSCRMTTDGGNGRFERSYAAWGGLAPIAGGVNRAVQLRNTTRIICK